MTQVFEKCDVLFHDPTLFSHPKTRAVDAERKTSKTLMWISIAMNLLILLTLIFSYFRFLQIDAPINDHIPVYGLIGALSLIAMVAALIVRILGRNRYIHYKN